MCIAASGADTQSRPPDPLTRAAEEFKVLTRDQGMRPESAATAQKSGPKMPWHGRVYENFRNDILDAVPHEVTQNGGDKSILRRNQFGFNVAGPVLIPHLITDPNNTFLMVSYEGVRERISRASLHTIPTAPERTGDFSQTVDQAGLSLPVYDPGTTAPNAAYDPGQPVSTGNLQYLRSPFPGNRIPESRLAPNIQEALKLYPLPNTDIGPFFQNNYFVNSPQTDTADGFIVKIDHPFHERHRLTSSTSISNGFLGSAKYFPNLASPTPPDQNFSTRRSELDYVFTATAKTVYTASLIATSSSTIAGDASQAAFPYYELGNYLAMGTPYPQTRNARNTYEMDASGSTRRGKHALRLALQADAHQVNSFNPAYPSGDFQFAAGLTSLPGIIDTGAPFASFLLGLPQYAERTITVSPSYFRDPYGNLSGSDNWQVAKNLTVSIGLNLGLHMPRVEKYNRQSTVDPAVADPSVGLPGALVFAGLNGIPRGLRPANFDIDPSVSLAWNPFGNANTVVRAGFSRSHGRIPTYNGQWATQGFNARQTFISANTQLSPALDLASGIPPLTTPLPDLSPSAIDNAAADYMDLTGREPVYQSASLSIEREIPLSVIVSAGASYSGGRDLLVGNSSANPNAVSPDALSYGDMLYNQAFHTTLQPFPQFTSFNLYGLYPAGRYQRDAGFLGLEKRASFGLTFTATYTFSKQIDDYSAPYGNQDFFHLQNDRALTASNPPQTLQVSYIYELPFGSGKPLLHFSGWRGPLVSGWSITGTAYWDGGRPLAMHPEFNNTGNVLATLNVNVVPGVDPHVPTPGPSLWFNPAAFSQPADFTVGNGPPTEPNLLGPSYSSLDLSVNKRLPLGERSIELSASAFDFLNHANWNYPDTGIGPAAAPNVNAGRIIGSHGGRVVQLGLKVSF
ncbi:MAG: hypothetical protein P4L56_08525 [Candidatus Sulfopaludibacter sp.]|nr:hypothetical protein [Candidatus Sulfopaludibacter sp.]